MAKTYQTTLLIRGDAKNAVRQVSLTRNELEKLTGAQGKSRTRTQSMGQAFLKANTSVGRLTSGLQGLGGLLGALGITAFARKTLDSADSLASMRGQLKLVTDSQEELNAVYSRALALSNSTGQATESTVNLYARMARATEELSLTQDQLFTITEAVNQSFVVSGASAQEASSATLQLSQGLAAGALRGEELNSVMENSPRLARALADGLGVSIGALREMGSEGELTAEAVTTALLSSADSITGEFNDMPVTIGRSMQALANSVNDALGDVDTSELTGAVSEAQKLIADPNFKAAIGDLATALVNVTANFAKALAAGVRFSNFLGEELSRRVNGAAYGDIAGMESELFKLQQRLDSMPRSQTRNAKTAENLKDRIEELTRWLRIAREEQALNARTAATLAGAQSDAAAEAAKNAREQDNLAQQHAQAAADAERQSTQEAALAANIEGLGNTAQSAASSVKTLTIAKGESAVAAETAAASASTAQAALKNLGREANPVAAAIERGAERMDDAFASVFKDLLRNGKVSFDALKNLFTDTLGEMIYAAARNKIFVGAGLSSASGAASAAGSLGGGFLSAGSALLSGLGNAAGGLYEGIGAGAQFLGFDGIAKAAADKSWGATGMGALGDIGGGIAGGMLGSAVFGETSGIGSTLGGIAGSFIPIPILGSAIGSFLGSGLESLLSGKPSDKTGTALLDLSNGGVDIGGLTGSKFSQENRDAASDLAQQFGQFAQAIGGSTGSLDIGVGNRDGLRLDGRDYGSNIDGFLDAGFAKIIQGAEQLDPALRDLIQGFDGTTEEMGRFAASVISLSQAANVNAVDMAVEAWERLTDGQRTATSVYYDQSDALRNLISTFDGSAGSAQTLNAALMSSRESAFQLATAILQTSDQIDSLTTDSAKFIRQSVLSEAELRAARQQESQTLLQSLRQVSDPDEIRAVFADFERVNKQLFQSLSPERQQETADQFASSIERANAIAQERLSTTLADIRAQEEATNAQINDLLTDGAQQLNTAAASFSSSAERFGAYVEQLISQGINVNLTQGLNQERLV